MLVKAFLRHRRARALTLTLVALTLVTLTLVAITLVALSICGQGNSVVCQDSMACSVSRPYAGCLRAIVAQRQDEAETCIRS